MSAAKKSGIFSWVGKLIKRIVIAIVVLLVLANVFILVTGRTYLYKGIKETYLKGRSGPGLYDSLVFPAREIRGGVPDMWLYGSPERTLNADQIERLLEVQTTSFLVIKNQKIVVEHYFDEHTPNTLSNSFSMSKSALGLLFGIARDKGEIPSFDLPISDYLDFIPSEHSNVTIKHLLAMTSDMDWSESGSNPLSDNAEAYYGSNLRKIMAKQAYKGNPDRVFDYASGNSQLLGFILQKATGKTVSQYMEENIWLRLNAQSSAFWSLDREDGDEKAFCCMYATTRDYARLGQLVLNNGVWGYDTIVKPATMKEITTNYVFADGKENHRYGLHYWILNDPDHKVIYARGILGQYIISIPDLDVVIVRSGHKRLDKFGQENVKEGDAYKIDHPHDLFLYLDIAKELLNNQ
jgi:CubicO group peptidase (beta-lactamase class C family)